MIGRHGMACTEKRPIPDIMCSIIAKTEAMS